MSGQDVPAGFSDDDVKRILRRAMELDQAKSEQTSATELQQIGHELGISRESIESAIRETGALASTRPAAPPVIVPSWRVPVIAAAAGMLASAQPLFFGPIQPTLPTMLGAQCSAVLIAMLYRGTARHQRFQLTNAALWVGFVAGWTYLYDVPGMTHVWETAIGFGSISAVAGGAAIWLRDTLERLRSTVTAAPADRGDGTSGTRGSPIRAWWRSIRSLLHRMHRDLLRSPVARQHGESARASAWHT